jgi:nucleotide-binding universal stress UspA family protein
MQHIVVGVDGSEEAWHAVDLAIEVARSTNAAITAIYAEHLPGRAMWGLGASLDDAVEADAEATEALTNGLRERNAEDGLAIGLELVKGRPADVLKESAERLGADLIVIGHKGHGGAVSWLGSVANDVLHSAEVSVLVAR